MYNLAYGFSATYEPNCVHFFYLQYYYVIRHLLILSALYAYSKDRPNLEINMDNFIHNKPIIKCKQE